MNYSLTLILLAAPVFGQQVVVVPSAASSRDGTTNCAMAGFTGRYRQQVLVSPVLLSGALGQVIEQITLRRDGAAPPLRGGAAQWAVRIGSAPFATIDAISDRFTWRRRTARR